MNGVLQVDLSLLQPQEVVVLIVAVGGLLPIILYYRWATRWVLIAYAFLLIGALATNIENLFWHDQINRIEHFVGNLGAGIAFAVAAYAYRASLTDEFDTDGGQGDDD